jgi:tRNA(Ile2) C34 agmatinyltransferase TiaS
MAGLAVASRDLHASQKLYDEHTHREVDAGTKQRADVAADFDAAETECPACGTRFKTAGAERCPDCGIAFR